MVIELVDPDTWDYKPKVHANVRFASASSPNGATITVLFNDAVVDRVHLSVPHSWWPMTGQVFCPTLSKKDTLKVVAEGGAITLRIDLDEFE